LELHHLATPEADSLQEIVKVISAQALRLFSETSHDRSRLHTSDNYARQTAHGEVIDIGILGAFASLSELQDRPELELAKVSLTYRQPLYMNVA
jgi:hypothetical protein